MYLYTASGYSQECNASTDTSGSAELVFTTQYTGYEESVTDPSYHGQALTFAYPLIGNYGFSQERTQSRNITPEAILVREATMEFRNACDEVPILSGVDTRSVVRELRENGSMGVGWGNTLDEAKTACEQFEGVSIESVPTQSAHVVNKNGSPTVAIIDCGMKDALKEAFVSRGCRVHVYSRRIAPAFVFLDDPGCLFITNGPGDPKDYTNVIEIISDALNKDCMVGGICLGHQLVALATGGDTEKMKFGHRGCNQPVFRQDDTIVITSQNHSYEVTDTGTCTPTHTNVNDGSVEGMEAERIYTVQYHAEANPGPNDSAGYFDELLSRL